ncbi:hypothetical protein CISG_03445 [Coccidioides immitis RMSCC 3703]|uniref:Uncharacterized protein n=2 Tax=Coccidioides immitis TaxID=5501 RepID=A0A0J8QLC2_COCIT|nr:hypothetical protein CIRG_03288 [Coccidioides immitis RMSCC 2394]KMU73185.1 hypothetical protein CISG_03445 [Coccidioides immitis RMSCC 3703]
MSPRREKEVQVSPNHAAGGLGNKTLSDRMGWTVSDSKGPSAAIGPRSPGRLDFELAQGTNKRHVCQRCRPKQGASSDPAPARESRIKADQILPPHKPDPDLLQRPVELSSSHHLEILAADCVPGSVPDPSMSRSRIYPTRLMPSAVLTLAYGPTCRQSSPSLDVSNSLLMHKTF